MILKFTFSINLTRVITADAFCVHENDGSLGGQEGVTVEAEGQDLPIVMHEGDTLYVMNDKGQTIDKYHGTGAHTVK